MNSRLLTSIVLAASLLVFGCGDDGGGTGGAGATGGSGGDGGGTGGSGGIVPVDCDSLPDLAAYSVEGAPDTPTDDCTGEIFMPGVDNASRLNTRISLAGLGDTICMAEGTYEMEGPVNISLIDGLTLKGIADSPDKTVLNFGGPGTGIGINVATADDVSIENLWVKNTGANGVVQDGTTGSRFIKVHVSWENADNRDNGRYGIYPTNCEDTLVEWSQTTGASDAGIYIGKCGYEDDATTGGIVRNNITAFNVAGLEVENSLDVIAHDNLVVNNTAGLLALQQQIEPSKPSNTNVEMYDNQVWCNNTPNFATSGTVAVLPPGTGALSYAGNGVELYNNDIQGNDTVGIGIISNTLICQFSLFEVPPDPTDCGPYEGGYNPYVQNVYVHDNFFMGNGADPQAPFDALFEALGFGAPPLDPVPSIIWDGYIKLICDASSTNSGEICFSDAECEGGACVTDDSDPGICLGTANTASYLDFTQDACQGEMSELAFGLCSFLNFTTETTNRDCEPTP